MSRSLNRVQLMGNLTADPSVKTTQNGTTVVTFAIATNRGYVDSSGQRQDTADFHNIVSFGKLAEICSNLLKVGSKVYLEGRLQTRKWEGQDGKTNYRTEIVAEDMYLLANGKAREENSSDYVSASSSSDSTSATKEAPAKKEKKEAKKEELDSVDEINLDEIPF